VSNCSLGITPASDSFVAFTITMNRIVLSPEDQRSDFRCR
jgi:hypothetical protein